MPMLPRYACLALLACALLAPPGLLRAETKALRIETVALHDETGGEALGLLVNGEIALRLSLGTQKRSLVEKRLAIASKNLLLACRQGEAQIDAALAPGGKYWQVSLNGKEFLSATEREAQAWGYDSAAELAQSWRDALEAALRGEPQEDARARDAASSLVGSSRPHFEVQRLTDGEAAGSETAAAPPDIHLLPQALEAEGKTPGVSALLRPSLQPRRELEREAGTGYIAGALPVYTPPSATLAPLLDAPSALTAQVTGDPASETAVKRALSQALRAYLRLGPLDSLSWDLSQPEAEAPRKGGKKKKVAAPPPPVDWRLARGLRKRLSLDYSAGGTTGTAELVLENLTLTPPPESLTMFSNNPEGLSRQQLLYRATLPARHSARLVYHHQNQSAAALYQVARVVNSGSEAQLVHILPGTCEPDANTYWVGFASAEDFLGNTARNSGWVALIPAGGSALLARQRLAPGATSSGYFKLTSLGRGDLSLETLALAPDSALPAGPWPGEAASACVFGPPYLEATATHTVGGDWTYLRLGAESPLCQLGSGARLWGCYGMTHDFDVTLANPAGSGLSTVYVILRGSAGEVKGQAIIDGRYCTTRLAPSGGEELLDTLTLQPGETRRLQISAIALNGGFYPASIILRETRDP